jgi:(p)ppGpp synthase/HD superfamily hydrolase
MTLLSKAMRFAARWHEEQVDKSGVPYVAHLMGVWARVRQESELVQCVALLHDILEDTHFPVSTLAAEFPYEVGAAVIALTHAQGEPYEKYIQRVKKNPIARIVKLADLADNTSEFRIVRLTEADRAYFTGREQTHYLPAIKELSDGPTE